MKTEKITLDKYDSQILLLSKFHFDDYLKENNLSRIDALIALWVDRCNMKIRYVRVESILAHIIDMLDNLNLLSPKEVKNLLSEAIDLNRGVSPLWREEDLSMIDTLIEASLRILSTVQVKESIEVDGERIYGNLIEMEDIYTSFLDVFKEEKVDEKSI